jgi:hypothetical protein
MQTKETESLNELEGVNCNIQYKKKKNQLNFIFGISKMRKGLTNATGMRTNSPNVINKCKDSALQSHPLKKSSKTQLALTCSS